MSHHSAAVVWGLPLFHSSLDRVEMSNPRFKRTGKSYRRRQRQVPNSLVLDGAGFDSRFGPRWPGAITPGDLGIAMTDVERTVLDITRDCTLSEAAMVLEAYLSGVLAPITNDHGAPEADRRTPVLGLDGRMSTFPLSQSEREARRARLLATATATDLGRRVPRLTRLLAISTGLSESPAEALANLGFHTLGLGVEQQAQICDSTGRIIAVADFLIRGTRCLLEVDGRKKYIDATGAADMARLEREKQRTDRIYAEGYHLLRCGWHEVTNPDIFGPLIWRGLRAARGLGRA
ncbi:hypothetical protein NQ036_11875 [Brevibacterium sp. 91QC2O2]|uniref:hypothetical protein n=1 Tax=Brevibacterium sp. 91QC2O2 TaxID=2968458 RepID=UPI00211C41B0|nr:hypothetical protein [Brevibacterium sp. 91QC2O2]MCQ9368937.1 hypothetical protein [Brevibacterium sp. 91QC2O2]